MSILSYDYRLSLAKERGVLTAHREPRIKGIIVPQLALSIMFATLSIVNFLDKNVMWTLLGTLIVFCMTATFYTISIISKSVVYRVPKSRTHSLKNIEYLTMENGEEHPKIALLSEKLYSILDDDFKGTKEAKHELVGMIIDHLVEISKENEARRECMVDIEREEVKGIINQ